MKTFLVIILSHLIPQVASAQQFVIFPYKNNTLYIGVDNPITIVTENYSSNKIEVTVDKGEIFGYGNTWVFKGFEPGFVTITLADKTTKKELGRTKFRVVYIPTPMSFVGASSGGDIQKTILASQMFLHAELDNFGFDVRFSVDSFSVMIIRDSAVLFNLKNIGAKFSNEVVTALSQTKNGDIILFHRIYAVGPDRRSLTLQSLVFRIV